MNKKRRNSVLNTYLTNLWSKYGKLSVLFVVFVFVTSLTGVSSFTRGAASAVTTANLNFQSRLLQASGSLVADGTYNIEFNLYTVASGGSTQWTETYLNTTTPVTIKNGYMSVSLGSLTAFPGTIDWDQEQWLGMTVRGTGSCAFGACTPTDAEMTPRFKLTAVPYAFKSAVSANVQSAATTTASTASAGVSVVSGNASGATSNSGNITIDSGTATATAGALLFGTTNASALTIGRAGVTTTLQGSVSLTGAGTGLAVTNNATIGGTLGVTSTSTFTGLLTANGGVTVSTGNTFTNASSTLFTAQAISNIAGGGAIGTAAATVDVATTFNVNQTTASQTLTLPTPTVATAGRIVYVSNVGSTSFTMHGSVINNGGASSFIWNGTSWVAALSLNSSVVTSIGTIDSQTKSANGAVIASNAIVLQTADATNVGLVSTGTQTLAGAKTFNTAASFTSAGTGLAVTNDATVGGTLAVTSTSTFTGRITANGGITASGADSNINASSNFNTNINTGTSSGTVAIGNSVSTTTILGTTNINTTGSANTSVGNGTGTFALNSSAFDVSTAGALSGITTIGLSGAITGATATDTINGLVINSGALSGITGFTQTSGNFSQAGAGTFGTGTGAISLNGATSVTGTNTLTVGTGATVLGGSLAVTGIQTFTGLGTFNGGLTVATGNTFTNASSTLLTALAVADKPAGGNIGTAAITVDVATTFNVNQTTASQTLTLPSPTVATAGRVVYINNVGSASFTMGTTAIAAGSSATYVWNGTAWVSLTNSSAAGVTTVGLIDSQAKSANGAVISGTTVYLQTADATNVGLVSTGVQTLAGAKTFSSLVTGSAGLTVTGADVNLNASSNFNTNINTGTSSGTTAIGNSLSTTNILGAANINTSGAATTTIGNATGALTINGTTTIAAGFSQTGANTFSSGTGAISLNGATSITGTNTLTVGTGLTSLGGALTVTGLTTLNGGLTVETGDNFTFNGDIFTDFTGGGLINSAGVLTVDTTSASGAFINGGNAFTANSSLGNTGNYDLNIKTNNITRLTVEADGDVVLAAGKSLQVVGGNTASRPASPTEGMVYYDTTTKQLLTYANGKWQADRSTATKIVAANNSSQAVKDSADYVADGTGDQTEINAALTAASGGKVYLAEGTYVASATILIPNNTTLAGAGSGTLIELADLDADENLIENTDTTTGTGVTIRDIRLDGRDDLNTAGLQGAIYLLNMGGGSGSSARQGAKLTNIIASNFRTDGIYLESSSNSTLTGNTSRGNFYGISIYLGANNTVINNVSQGNSSIGFYIGSNDNTFTGNSSQGNSTGFYTEQAVSNTISANTTEGNANTGYFVDDLSTNNTISGNTSRNDVNKGFYIRANSSYNSFVGNSVRGSVQGFVLENASNNNLISANKIHDNGGATANNGIYLDASDNNTITGNDITDTSCTTNCYAINIFNSTSDNNYLGGNTFSSTGDPATINDAGTGTRYANQTTAQNGLDILFKQANSATAFRIQDSSGGNGLTVNTTTLGVTTGGTLGVTGVATFSSDLIVNGNTTIGNATTDRLTVTSQILGASPLVFQGATDNGFATTLAFVDPTANNTITFPDASGTVQLAPTSGSYLLQVPGSTAANTITPTANSVVGLTVNATSGTAATAAIINQTQAADGVNINTTNGAGTQTNGLLVARNGAGTTTNLLNLTNTSGTATNALNISGTFTNLINATNLTVTNAGNADFAGTLTAGTADAFQVNASGAVTAVGVNAGSGLLQGTGGLTITGTASINTTGTSNTAIGNATGTFALTSSALNVSTGGALTGVTGITTSGGYTQSGATANTLTGATTVSGALSATAAGTGLAVTNNATIGGNLTVGSGAGVGLFTNNGATLNSTLQIADVAAGGAIGTAAATVDIYTSVAVLQTTAGRTLTIPTPTTNPTTVFGRVLYLSNVGTVSFTLGSTTVNPGTTATLIWSNTDGAATTGESWQFAGADGNGILNQNAADQTANFRISGTGRANTSFTTPLVDSITGALSIGTSTATGITIGGAATTGTIALGASAASTINLGTGAFAHTIAIGNDATTAQGITIGSINATSTTTIRGGTGASALALQAGSGGTISIGASAAATVNIGTGAFAHTIAIANDATTIQGVTIGSTFSTSATTIQGGTGGINLTGVAPDSTYGAIATIGGTLSSTTNQFLTGLKVNPTVTVGSSANIGFFGAIFAPTTSTANLNQASSALAGAVFQPTYTGSGTITAVAGFTTIPTNASSGTVGAAYGFTANSPVNSGGGTIQRTAGVVVVDQTVGSLGNANILLGTGTVPNGNYSIYSASTSASLFSGQLIFNNIATDITTGTNETLTVTPNGTGSIVLNSASTSASAIDLNATATVAGNAITVDTTDGGIALTAGGVANGDISLTVGDDFTLNGVGDSVYTIGAATVAGTITIGGTAQTGAISLGSGTGIQAINLGTGGTGAKTVTVGSQASSSSVVIDAGTGAISIGTSASARTTNIATGGAVQTVTLGSTNTTSATTIAAGSGAITFNASQAQFSEVTGTRTLTVQTRTSNIAGSALTISAGTAGAGGAAFTGGLLTIQGGNAGGTGNANGANVSITGGTGTGTGVKGLVVIDTPTYNTATAQNFTASANITQANIDNLGGISITQNQAGWTATLTDPTITTAGRVIYVTNAGTFDITLAANTVGVALAISLKPASTATMFWNGTDWTAAGASSSTDLQAAYNNTATSAGGAELVLNASGGAADGLTVRNNATSPIIGGIFEAQTSVGSNLFSVNNNATEYATNGGAETAGGTSSTFPASTWSATPTGGTVARNITSANNATGQASVSVATTAALHGARNQLSGALSPNLKYTVSYTAKAASASFTGLETVYSSDGTNTVATTRKCIPSATYYSTGTASQSGTTITGVGTTWTSAMTGQVLAYANGVTAKIAYVSSTTSITAVESQTVSSQSYTINPSGASTNAINSMYSTGTASQTASANVIGVGTTWTAAMVGTTLVYANGTAVLITGFTNATTLVAAVSLTTGATQAYNLNTAGMNIGTSSWTRVTCSFTAPSSGIASGNSIFIRQTDGSSRTFYIDNLSVSVSADVNHAVDGSVDNALGSNWTAIGGSVARNTSVLYDTSGSVAATTGANARGVYNNLTLGIIPQVSTQYRVAFYARGDGTNPALLSVAYTPDNNSTTVACTDYNTQTAAAAAYTLVTCLLTTSATTPVTSQQLRITQTGATPATFYIDALSITLNNNNANNVQIGAANKGGPITLFTLDRASNAPIAANNDAYLGSMYYDTTSGRIQCYEADGWGACGSAPDNYVNLNPEYAGAVLNGAGVGTMTADFCANQVGVLVVGTLCATGESRNFYRWTSPQASPQTYSIYVSYQLPATFKGFASDSTVQLTGRTSSTTDGSVTYEMFRNESGVLTACGTATAVTTVASTWQTVGINGNESTGCSFSTASANAFVIFKINVTAQNNANVYVGTLGFTTTGR